MSRRRRPRFPLWPRVEILNPTDPLAVMVHWLNRHWYYVDGDR